MGDALTAERQQSLRHLLGRAGQSAPLVRVDANPWCSRARPRRSTPTPSAPVSPGRVRSPGMQHRRLPVAVQSVARLPVSSNHAFQASACRAVSPSIRSPVVPIIIGRPLGRGPRGRSSHSRAWWSDPEVNAPLPQQPAMIVSASSKRLGPVIKGKPKARYSGSFQPAPRPR